MSDDKARAAAKTKVAKDNAGKTPAEVVVEGIIEKAKDRGLSRAQIDFLRTCLTMLPESHPHQNTLFKMSGGVVGVEN